jgi:thiamine pyrophosphate-dependent acetolactate synthase large subunit-like protein
VYLRIRKKGNRASTMLSEIIPAHNWADFARTLGAPGITVEEPGKLRHAYELALKHTSKDANMPFVVNVVCDPDCETPNTT